MRALLSDVERGVINAVCVRDLNRWARKNEESKRAIEVLRDKGVAFYAGGIEYDLGNPTHRMMLGIQGEVAERVSSLYAHWSVDSRSKLARLGFLATGSAPFGRECVGAGPGGRAVWRVIPKDQKWIEKACKLIESGKSFRVAARLLSAKYGEKVHDQTVCRRIYSAGSTWTQAFKNTKHHQPEVFVTTIPPLVPDERIARIKQLAADRKRRGRPPKEETLVLRRKLRCSHCGSLLTVFKKAGIQYVRHWGDESNPRCFTQCLHYDAIEASFFYPLGPLLRDGKAIRTAAESYFTRRDSRIPEMQEQFAAKKAELAHVQEQHAAFVRMLGLLDPATGDTLASIKREIATFDRLLPSLREEVRQLEQQLANTERPAKLDVQVTELLRTLRGRPVRWNLANKRAWADGLFGTRTLKFQEDVGVYVTRLPDGSVRWEAAGRFGVFGGVATQDQEVGDRYYDDGDWASIDRATADEIVPQMQAQPTRQRPAVRRGGGSKAGAGGQGLKLPLACTARCSATTACTSSPATRSASRYRSAAACAATICRRSSPPRARTWAWRRCPTMSRRPRSPRASSSRCSTATRCRRRKSSPCIRRRSRCRPRSLR
jgi:DNA invertase Pin-like site-specific DNA recombinase